MFQKKNPKLLPKTFSVILFCFSVPIEKPRNFREDVASKKTNQLSFKWDKLQCNETNGDISSYRITYWSLNDWDLTNLSSATNDNSIFIHSLTPFTLYEVRVRAATSAGLSKFYSRLTSRTLSDGKINH